MSSSSPVDHRPADIASEAVDPDAAVLTIAEVERQTNISKDSLRMWERRYGFPAPVRDALGERRYSLAALERLQWIKRLLDAGQRPGQVIPMSPQQLQSQLGQAAAMATRARRGAAARQMAYMEALSNDWLLLIQEHRLNQLRDALGQEVIRLGLGDAIEQVFAPLSVQVGQAWLRGDLSIYQEHLFSEVLVGLLRENLARLDALQARDAHGPRVLLTTLPGEQHLMGLLMAECFFALQRCQRFQLGSNTPLPDIEAAVAALDIDVLAISCSVHASAREVLGGLTQLRHRIPESRAIWVGGSAPSLRSRKLPIGVVHVATASALVDQIVRWRQTR